MTHPVLTDRPRPGVLMVTINRPEQRNAISVEVASAVDGALADAARDDDARAIVLTGAGDRAFSAGYDIHEMTRISQDEAREMLRGRAALLWRLLSSPVPVVAALNGAAHGGGAMWATCCDLRVGGPRSALRFAAVQYGGVAMTWILDALVGGAWARDLLLTARLVDATEAHRIGLVTRWVDDPSAVLETALDAAEQLAGLPPEAVRSAKELLLTTWGTRLQQRYDSEQAFLSQLLDDREPSQIFASFLTSTHDTNLDPHEYRESS